ncbi:hypothetical protein DFH11DRAFT_1134923 [Phellopilus nigrolimitatus]|nr:hypothetical protein DFH11DRAFT_1134923 [Phellopilus nigrolimitatus]
MDAVFDTSSSTVSTSPMRWSGTRKMTRKKFGTASIPSGGTKSLVLHAQTYGTCIPLSKQGKSGWYDNETYRELDLQSEESGSGVEGFTGAVLGEDDDSESATSISRSVSPEPLQSTIISRPKPPVISPTTKSSTDAKSRPRAPFPYVLVPTLNAEQRARFSSKKDKAVDEPASSTPRSVLRAGTPHASIHDVSPVSTIIRKRTCD